MSVKSNGVIKGTDFFKLILLNEFMLSFSFSLVSMIYSGFLARKHPFVAWLKKEKCLL